MSGTGFGLGQHKCCVHFCSKFPTKPLVGIIYLQFPEDDKIAYNWMVAILDGFDSMPHSTQLNLLEVYKKKTVCSRHFLPTDYVDSILVEGNKTKLRQLKKNACPSLIHPMQQYQRYSIVERLAMLGKNTIFVLFC